jgi:hypothetical protein
VRLPLVLALVLALTGCGGGGDGDRLSQEELSERAQEICGEARSELDAIDFDGDSSEAVAAYAAAAAPVLRERLAELERLEPPADAEEPWAQFLEEARREARALEQLEEAAREEDHRAAGKAARAGRQAAIRTAALAQVLGIQACVNRSL